MPTPRRQNIRFSSLSLRVLPTRFMSSLLCGAALLCTPLGLSTPALAQGVLGAPTSLADLVEQISPAVVNIKVTTASGETTTLGQGSGFVISTSGQVVTNYHVIEGGDNIAIEFNNGDSLPGSIIGTDEETDLALLQINAKGDFPIVQFYEGNPVRIGDYVIAIGNPFGIGQSTSLGIISAIGRDTVQSGEYVDYIQTDATINTGNSGGPLFNPQGYVIGVNSAIFSPTGSSVGIAFAIPHETAREVITAIQQDGSVRRGWLGVGLREAIYTQENNPDFVKAGATVNHLFPGGPAEQQGLRIDDIILKINGTYVKNSIIATRRISRLKPGEVARMEIERNEQPQTLSIRVAERPKKDVVDQYRNSGGSQRVSAGRAVPRSGGGSSLGYSSGFDTSLSLVDLSSSFRDAIGMRRDQVGIYVEAVTTGSAADTKGLRSGMVILESDNKPVPSVRDFRKMYNAAKKAGQSAMTLKVRRNNGGESYVSLPVV